MTQFIADISEFLYEQSQAHAMKGLSREPDIYDYLIHKEERKKMYVDVVEN